MKEKGLEKREKNAVIRIIIGQLKSKIESIRQYEKELKELKKRIKTKEAKEEIEKEMQKCYAELVNVLIRLEIEEESIADISMTLEDEHEIEI